MPVLLKVQSSLWFPSVFGVSQLYIRTEETGDGENVAQERK